MGLEQANFEGKTKVEVAIMRLQEFEKLAGEQGYYLAFSGGKDSIVVYDLAVKAGVKFDTHYAQGGIDPPELVAFIREHYPSVAFERPSMSVWQGAMVHGMPRRQSRWCCELIKEKGGSGRYVLTGIRWAESARRKQRKMVEICRTDKTKVFLHPIIDWSNSEIWQYIHENKLDYCSLYDEGFKRIGCVLCPMQTARQTQLELERFPKLAQAWKRACERYFNKGVDGTKRWNSAEEMWQWWLSRKSESKDDAQCIMFDN